MDRISFLRAARSGIGSRLLQKPMSVFRICCSIHKLIVIGLIAHTCVEATVRYAAELGYEVTVVADATADYSVEEMHAALDTNIPNYAVAIVTANEIANSISSL